MCIYIYIYMYTHVTWACDKGLVLALGQEVHRADHLGSIMLCIYIYIYIEREMYMYMYVYMYMYTYR